MECMRYRLRYTLIGFFLGLGAPIGSLIWQVIIPWPDQLLSRLLQEWHGNSYFYNYMTVGTVTAFVLFGNFLGKKDENLGHLAITDGLTGIYNHRHLHESLTQEIERAKRYNTPLTCLMLDIDDFKKVNDEQGHPFGDYVLKKIAHVLLETMRRTDIVGRYGGEEFLVLMPHTHTQAALPIAERLIAAIQNCPFETKNHAVQVTASIGLATFPTPEHGVKGKNSLLSAVDQALYKAKREGKNRISIWADTF